ncbi:MAG TPA: outer membrane beta-barrel protein [Candidatus Limnocylindrales bacterium]|nr:outer membrane beta-barrel protein [Candidatus Limnocylindrales bacterium]
MADSNHCSFLHKTFHSFCNTRFLHLCALLILLLSLAVFAKAQDSPGRFEAGGNFTAMRTRLGGNFGTGVEGDLNLGRHFAVDGAFNWLPAAPGGSLGGQVLQGLFGGKVGTRTEHFGLFGKVRPGFISISNVLREETFMVVNQPQILAITSFRFDRLTERALDYGGVFEYYPNRRWALRWDFGDTVLFEESPKFNAIGALPIDLGLFGRSRTTNHFQFSTGLHYRF